MHENRFSKLFLVLQRSSESPCFEINYFLRTIACAKHFFFLLGVFEQPFPVRYQKLVAAEAYGLLVVATRFFYARLFKRVIASFASRSTVN